MDTHGDAAHGKSKWSEVGNDWCGAEWRSEPKRSGEMVLENAGLEWDDWLGGHSYL